MVDLDIRKYFDTIDRRKMAEKGIMYADFSKWFGEEDLRGGN